jgi:hypothetical protein
MLDCLEIYFSRNPKQYAPLQLRRTKANPVPWITPTIKQLMREMDYHKKAIKFNSIQYTGRSNSLCGIKYIYECVKKMNSSIIERLESVLSY